MSILLLQERLPKKSITLIKNKNNLLPLDRDKYKNIVVLGDLAKVENIGDYGSSQVHPPYVKTFMQALEENYSDVNITFVPTSKVTAKADEIKKADTVIILCGMRHGDEGEYIFVIGGDRKKLSLKKRETEMLKFAGLLNKNTVAVVMGGNVITMGEWKNEINSIMMAYYPGMEGGNAIADIIFGKVNPSGKLPFAIAKNEADYPDVKWISLHQDYGYYNGYRKLEKDGKKPDFPYGFGLSFTYFELSDAKLINSNGEKATFSVTVKNTGERKGAEVVQLYSAWNDSAVDRPVKTLSDFCRVELEAGESKIVSLEVCKVDLAYYSEEDGFIEEDILYSAFIGNDESSCEKMKIDYRF